MANEIQLPHSETGVTLYAVIRNAVGEVWDTGKSIFEAYSTASLGDYDIALAEQGTASQFYVGTFPAAISRGVYSVAVYKQAGGSPAEGDTLVGAGTIHWDGSKVIPLSKLKAAAYDSATRSGNVITLADGSTQTISDTGRATVEL